jgi:hypothetical protein
LYPKGFLVGDLLKSLVIAGLFFSCGDWGFFITTYGAGFLGTGLGGGSFF